MFFDRCMTKCNKKVTGKFVRSHKAQQYITAVIYNCRSWLQGWLVAALRLHRARNYSKL